MDEQHTIVYGYNDNTNDAEETETILSTNQTRSTTKHYKCVWRKTGRWIARIQDPASNSRVFLGKFYTSEVALAAYFKKKSEFESQIRVSNGLNSVMIDGNGFLLGDFSRLDDDLKMCQQGIELFGD
ncbi:ethylene-responsive transcription factor RAP2-9-like [Helianthus annuus]|uniref:ethylene-responsive transcription factor RAP2-9-like n=1 Tax=Helianthus annuus TaxID=4232 RepID=UPI000B8F7B12|nr:ethylene-responsive transcription factor RAP2-9-like [Helianthus annuus]